MSNGSSALIGQPPLNEDDYYIRKGLLYNGVGQFFPNKKLPFGPPRPYPNSPDPWLAGPVLSAAVGILVVMTAVVAGRFIIRIVKRVKFGLDDFFCILAWLIATGYMSADIYMATSPQSCLGRHIWFCTYAEFNNLYAAIQSNIIVFWPGVYMAKLSVLFLFRRIVGLTRSWWNIAFWTMLGILIIFGVFSFFITLFTCRDVEARIFLKVLGMHGPQNLHCLPEQGKEASLALRGFHIATDLVLLSLPIIVIWKLQMRLGLKISVIFLFCFGCMTTVASIFRNYAVTHPSEDSTVSINQSFIWDLIDLGFAVMCTSLPAYSSLVDAAMTRFSKLGSSLGSFTFGSSRSQRDTQRATIPDNRSGENTLNNTVRGQDAVSEESLIQSDSIYELQSGHNPQKQGLRTYTAGL